MGQRTPWNYRQGFKATGYGRNKQKAGPYIPPQEHLRAFVSGPGGVRPSKFGPFTNGPELVDWQQRLPQGHPGRNYRWDGSQDWDGDGANEGLVYDGNGNVVGVNGMRMNKPNWAKNVNWYDKESGAVKNRYEYNYGRHKDFNAAEGVDSLKDIRRQVELVVKGYIDTAYPKVPGQKSVPERKVNRKAIASYLIGHPEIGGGALLDEQFVQTHDLGGKDIYSALGSYHNSKEYRISLSNNLTAALQSGKINAATEQFIQANK
jgi:hypothetical protein